MPCGRSATSNCSPPPLTKTAACRFSSCSAPRKATPDRAQCRKRRGDAQRSGRPRVLTVRLGALREQHLHTLPHVDLILVRAVFAAAAEERIFEAVAAGE